MLKRVPIFYILKGGNFTGPNIAHSKIIIENEEDNIISDVNLNSINLIIDYKNYGVILTTGHSVFYDSIVIDKISFNKVNSIKEIIEGDFFYRVNNQEKDYALIYSPKIKQNLNKITLDKDYIQSNSLKLIDSYDVLIKNGKSTGLTYAKILFDLSSQIKKDSFELGFNKISQQNIYKIEQDNKIILIFNLKYGSKICDYLLVPSEEYYTKRTIIENNPAHSKTNNMSSCISALKLWFTDSKINTEQIKTLVANNNIGEEYYLRKQFGWLSLQGDSGSGYYKIIEDLAHLVGINVQGAIAITLIPGSEYYDDITWDFSDKKIKIKNWIVESLYKCSVVLGINTIERFIREDTGDQSILIN